MYYTIYKTTNKITGKIYIGAHKTNNLDDGYLGSGKLIKAAIKKYGAQNFFKEILYTFDNLDDMYNKERELVNTDYLITENTYNIKIGGSGFTEIDQKRGSELGVKTRLMLRETDPNWQQEVNKKISNGLLRGYQTGRIQHYKGHIPGKYSHTDNIKKQMSFTRKGKSTGEKNSQYGTCWIYNPTILLNKKISKKELSEYLTNGWIRGRRLYLG